MKGRGWIGPSVVAGLVFLLHVFTNGSYGWFRDELYFIACGDRLAFGYVDQPPLIALIARVARDLSFGSVMLFRMPAALAGAALVLLTARLARRFGAGERGATLASLAIAISPTFLVVGHLMTMNSFEVLFWLGAASCVVEVLDGRATTRLWVILGAVIGLGLMNKHSMVFYTAALVFGVLVSRGRRTLTARGVGLAAAVAAVIVLPHAIWQATHDFPMFELLENGRKYKNAPISPLEFTAGQFLEQHPLNAIVWVSGIIFLARGSRSQPTQNANYRPLLIAHLALFFLLMAMSAKVYYFAPAYPVLYAAGGAWFEARPRFVTTGLSFLMIAGGAVTAPLVLPILDPPALVDYQKKLGFTPPRMENMRYSELPQHLADELGWEDLTAAVARAVDRLPEADRRRAVIFAQNYGEAGALEHFGRAHQLPPVYSGHNNYWLWGPPEDDTAPVIIFGGDPEDNRKACPEVQLVERTPANAYAIPNETEVPIYLCPKLEMSWRALWPLVKRYH